MTWYSLMNEALTYITAGVVVIWVLIWAFVRGLDCDDEDEE